MFYTEDMLDSRSPAHHFNSSRTSVHTSDKIDRGLTADLTIATTGVGITSGIQRAAVNSASSSDRLVPFTTTMTSYSSQIFTTTSGGSTFTITSSVPVLITSTAISTLPAVNSASNSDRLVPFTTTMTSYSSETLTTTSGGSTFTITSSVPVLVTSTGISTLPPTSTVTAVEGSSASPSVDATKVGLVVVIVVVPLLALGICIWLFVRRRRQRSRSRTESQKQLEESIHPATLLGPAHIPDIKKNDMDIIIAPNSEVPQAQPTSNPFETPAEQLAALSDSAIQTPSQHTEQQMIAKTEIDSVRSQMAALQHSNQEMKATMARMMEHVRRLEADMAAEEGSEFSDARPPTYVSS